jgi:sec-independent protein translocase protein TatC
MPFLDHLEELRWRILWSILSIVVGAGVGFVLVLRFDVIGLLLNPLTGVIAEIAAAGDAEWLGSAASGRLAFLSLTEPFFFILKIGILSGLILASPIVIYQAWAFLSPALEKREKRVIIPSLYFGLILFSAGVVMAYFIALPVTIRFLLLFGSEYFQPVLTAGYYLSFVMRLLLAFGIVFELPVVVMILSALGLVTPAFLRAKRRHAIVSITVLASFLSPGDVISVTVLLMAPLIILYEVSILLSAVIYRRREAQMAEVAEPPEGTVEAG